MRYLAMIRRTQTGYSVDVPDVPGCIATGLTFEHSREQIAEALQGHLELMRRSGEQIPAANRRIGFGPEEDADAEFCTWIEVEIEESAALASGD